MLILIGFFVIIVVVFCVVVCLVKLWLLIVYFFIYINKFFFFILCELVFIDVIFGFFFGIIGKLCKYDISVCNFILLNFFYIVYLFFF